MSPRHVVVDGSNIATEGRSLPSLRQLDEAVREFLTENPDDIVTVVVDASFGHRIDPSELPAFEAAEEAGEVVSPPAGAIGRGDAFLLRIAEKTGATVLSNDSFQEFHGEHEWVFERGRLIGGKPVPGVGWIFTPRTPVRGPKSREAVKEAKRKARGDEPSAPVPMVSTAKGRAKKVTKAIATATDEVTAGDGNRRRRRRTSETPAEPVNAPLAFITFIAAHPLGSEVSGVVDAFSSHGAFVVIGDVRCYIPLSAMGEPPPRRAREIIAKGEERSFVVQALDPQRRGIELALPGYARVAGGPTEETVEAEIRPVLDDDELVAAGGPAPAKSSRRRRSTPAAAGPEVEGVAAGPLPERAPVEAPANPPRRAARTKRQPAAAEAPSTETALSPEVATRAGRAKKAAGRASGVAALTGAGSDDGAAGRATGRRATKASAGTSTGRASGRPATKAPAAKAPATKAPAAKAPAAKAAAKKAGSGPTAAKKAPATKKQAVAKKAVEKAPAAKKSAAAKKAPAAKQAPAQKAAPSKRAAPAKKAVATKAPAKKAAPERAPAAKKASSASNASSTSSPSRASRGRAAGSAKKAPSATVPDPPASPAPAKARRSRKAVAASESTATVPSQPSSSRRRSAAAVVGGSGRTTGRPRS
jgi:Zc3h12a-like Ribonuclease NYN domain/S1 RNA binding domain